MEEKAIASLEHRALFQTSIETRLLYQRLKTMGAGETITYTELNKLIGQDVQERGRGALTTARHTALRDNQIVTDAIPNIGIKRLSDHETVLSGSNTFTKIRRLASRGARRMTAVNFADLSESDQMLHNASLSALAIHKLMAKPKTVDRIMGAVNATNTGQLPIARTLELFRGPRPAT